MSTEEITHIEIKLDRHMEKHDEDYAKLLWWIIGTLVTVVIFTSGLFISMGKDSQRIDEIYNNQNDYVTRAELTGAIALINNKFENISSKLDDIKLSLKSLQ